MLNNAAFDKNAGALLLAFAYTSLTVRCIEVVVAPPTLYAIAVAELLRKDVKVAAQNCYIKASGAFTGETSEVSLVRIAYIY